jgi:hypothetical protein
MATALSQKLSCLIPGVQSRRFCPEAKRFHERKKARTNNIVATKALAHKLARASYIIKCTVTVIPVTVIPRVKCTVTVMCVIRQRAAFKIAR